MTYPTRAIGAAIAAFGFVISTAAALATPAQSTVALNVRAGPGTSYSVVDTLTPGEVVDVTECVSNGWCHVDHSGPDGWVSSNYLTAVSGAPSSGSGGSSPSDSDCGFGITIGPDGPAFSVNCGNATPPSPPPAPPPAPTPSGPANGEACFYTGSNYSGTEFCQGPATLNTLGSTLNDAISSVRVNNVKVQLCSNTNLNGVCRTIDSDRPNLGAAIRNKASSLRVFKALVVLPTPVNPLPVNPTTFSTGPINLKQTYMANLDNGQMSQAGADIWYEAKTATQKFITPVKGARIAVGDRSNRGFSGCQAATYSTARVPLWQIPPGSYVCVKTNQNRISQFRINGYAGTTMKLGYTTWSN